MVLVFIYLVYALLNRHLEGPCAGIVDSVGIELKSKLNLLRGSAEVEISPQLREVNHAADAAVQTTLANLRLCCIAAHEEYIDRSEFLEYQRNPQRVSRELDSLNRSVGVGSTEKLDFQIVEAALRSVEQIFPPTANRKIAEPAAQDFLYEFKLPFATDAFQGGTNRRVSYEKQHDDTVLVVQYSDNFWARQQRTEDRCRCIWSISLTPTCVDGSLVGERIVAANGSKKDGRIQGVCTRVVNSPAVPRGIYGVAVEFEQTEPGSCGCWLGENGGLRVSERLPTGGDT